MELRHSFLAIGRSAEEFEKLRAGELTASVHIDNFNFFY